MMIKARYSPEEFQQRMVVRIRELEEHQDARPYSLMLAAIRQSLQELQREPVRQNARTKS
ncbi:hypothetical protein [Hymenobacter sp. BT730]|uniref:hypothetical protein n=1 Tax=Hymenobacter sp. BT730 TaxID=3063332 RepID=UPI0026DEF113|nr:hypothetical protein [Hymenobacter sp. BT730]